MPKVSGTEPGQRRLNGPQTSGRTYRNLSAAVYGIREDLDEPVPVRDGIQLMADVYRPDAAGAFPALIAFSPYPRQIQNSGLPIGFVEAGATDFFVPRGYAHVLVNARGTGGSGGVYTFADGQESEDLYDVVEWVAERPWCDGRVGIIGISYFAIAGLRAAAAAPPHLVAAFPFSGVTDLYREALWPGGILSQGFASGWLAGVASFNHRRGSAFRSAPARLLWRTLRSEPVHRRFERMRGEEVFAVLGKAMRGRADPHPWNDLFLDVALAHRFDDDFWQKRNVAPQLDNVRIPVYLGSDWDNVTLELPGVFSALDALPDDAPTRVAILGRGGLTWPWESFHVEALAWFDQWLKSQDTGVMDGPPIRFWLEGADRWHTADEWPLANMRLVPLHLRTDGQLGAAEGVSGRRQYDFLPSSLRRMPSSSAPPLPEALAWDTEPATRAYDVVGPAALELDAITTAEDVDWIVKLQLVAPDGSTRDLTQGWLRGSHRTLDENRSRPGRPYHTHQRAEPIEPGEATRYTIGIVPTAQRVLPEHRIRMLVTSSDLTKGMPMAGMQHLPLGTPSRQSILSSSRLLLPVTAGDPPD